MYASSYCTTETGATRFAKWFELTKMEKLQDLFKKFQASKNEVIFAHIFFSFFSTISHINSKPFSILSEFLLEYCVSLVSNHIQTRAHTNTYTLVCIYMQCQNGTYSVLYLITARSNIVDGIVHLVVVPFLFHQVRRWWCLL